jgi:catechol 2,3-dioxygenase-like lactoylglutathione lyase family enzyme
MAGFYKHVGGLSEVYADDHIALFAGELRATPYHLAIVRGEEKGLHHFSFEVRDTVELERATAEARRQGCRVECEQAGPLKRGVFVLDPDGFRIEFFVRAGSAYRSAAGSNPALVPYMV